MKLLWLCLFVVCLFVAFRSSREFITHRVTVPYMAEILSIQRKTLSNQSVIVDGVLQMWTYAQHLNPFSSEGIYSMPRLL